MKNCTGCGERLKNRMTIDGIERNMQNRTKCLTCLPFKHRPPRKTQEEARKKKAADKNRKWMSEKRKQFQADPVNEIRKDRKSQLIRALGGGCQICSYNSYYGNLVFHHLHDKKFQILGQRLSYSWERLYPELIKCVLLCHNCHGEVHAGMIEDEKIKSIHESTVEILRGLRITRLSLSRI